MWEGRIVVGHKENGKPIFRSVFAYTQKELMDKLHDSIELYRDVELTAGYNMTPAEWLDEYKVFTIRTSTLEGYRYLSNCYIKPYLGDWKLSAIKTEDVQKLYNWLKENGRVNEHREKGDTLSDSMIRGIHMMLHQAMDMAVRERLIVKNPTNGTVVPRPNHPPKQVLTEEQMKKFLTVVDQDTVWTDFFYTELTTGLRRGEICGLRWQDFDEKTGRLYIHRSVRDRKGGGVTVGETKTEKGARMPRQVQKSILSHANCKQVRFHDLRHTFTTMALEHGMDVKTLSAMLGHISSATTLDIYSHVTDTMKHQAAVRIDNHITGTHQPLPEEEKCPLTEKTPFEPYKGKYRKPGTGGVYQLSDHLWEGKYSPRDAHGKRISRNVYAKTREECEEKLAAMIAEVKKEIAVEKEKMRMIK